MQFTDTAAVAGTRLTNDGYLIADVRCARTGCQLYHASDLGLAENRLVAVYRPESVVFDKASLATFAGKPVTLGHPPEQVTADNWRSYAVGDVGEEIARDGEFVRVPMKLMDAAAIKMVQDGTREISMGYTTNIEIKDGVAPDGTPYQAVQTGPIRINHLAIVKKARGGADLRIGDSADARWGASPIIHDREDVTMADAVKTRIVLIDGLSVETTDAGAQALEKLTKTIADKENALTDAAKAHAAAIAAKDECIGKLKADLKAAQDAAKIDVDKLVADRSDLVEQVKAIDAKIDAAGKTDADLRKAAVASRLGDEMVKDASEAEVLGMFKAIAKDAKPADPVRKAMQDGKTVEDINQAYAARDKALADAWKTPVKEA